MAIDNYPGTNSRGVIFSETIVCVCVCGGGYSPGAQLSGGNYPGGVVLEPFIEMIDWIDI